METKKRQRLGGCVRVNFWILFRAFENLLLAWLSLSAISTGEASFRTEPECAQKRKPAG